jgi:hypothetical protein
VIDLHRIHGGQLVFDGLLDRDDLVLRLVKFRQRRIKGRGLATAGGAGDQYQTMRFTNQAVYSFQYVLLHPELGQGAYR